MLKLLNFFANENLAEQLDDLLDTLATVALYLTIAVVVGLVVWAIVVRNRDEGYLAQTRKIMTKVVVGYALVTIAVLGGLKLAVKILEEAFDVNFWIVFGLFAIALVGVALCVVLNKKGINTKWIGLSFAVAFVVYALVMSIFVPTVDESYNPINNQDSLYVTLTLLLLAVIVALSLLGSKQGEFDTKALSYGAVCVALSFALSYVKFFSMPQGGSVTFASLLPLALYSYMFGTRRGVIVGVVYGLLQFVQSPQFYQPLQVVIDYPIAFGAIGVAGVGKSLRFTKNNVIAQFVLGTTVAVLLRYCAHTLSGYFVFYSWAPIDEGYTALTWALVYNLYVLVDLLILLAMGCFALTSKTLRTTLNTTSVYPA